MNVQLYLENLAVQLNDTSHTTFSTDALQTIMCLAVRAYNRFRPLLRPFGTGCLYVDAAATAAALQVVGGPFNIGDLVTVKSSFGSEDVTISGIAAGTNKANWMGVPVELTVTPALTGSYTAGSTVGPATPGLNLVGLQSLYPLPLDFINFDQTSWDLANGSRVYVKACESFYDGAYTYSSLLSGVGWGQAQTFNSGAFGPGPYLAGVPDGSGVLNVPTGSAPTQMLIEVLTGNIPMLSITPPPGYTQTWQFAYYATNQPETVPDADLDAIIDAGRQIATQMILQTRAGQLDLKDVDQEINASEGANNLIKVAEECLKQFDLKIRKRPYMLMGATKIPYFLSTLFSCQESKRQKRSESIRSEM